MTTAVQVQYRRDTAANVATFTGAAGEAVVDTTNWRWVVQDGTTAGGYPHALVANLPFGGFKNLILGNVAGPQSFAAPTTPNNQVKIKADFLSVFNTTLSVSALLSSVNVTADITVSGVNGLDTGAVSINSWYAIFVIYNPTTKTTSALLSLSATSPTLPSGYTYLARVGWMRTNASSQFLRLLQQGRRAQYVVVSGSNTAALPSIITGASGNVNAPTWTSASVATVVPTTANALIAMLFSVNANAMAAPNNSYGAVLSTSNPAPLQINGNIAGAAVTAPILLEGSNVFYAAGNSGAGLFALGWEDNL